MGQILDATTETFDQLVAEGTVLVDVWGPACQPCLALMPHVERMADERPELKVVKVEAPKARRLCMNLRVMGLPAYLLFLDGTEVGRLAGGDISADRLEAWVDETTTAAVGPAPGS